jgi:pimeloyl-ACP methyl ester carboxylesterase
MIQVKRSRWLIVLVLAGLLAACGQPMAPAARPALTLKPCQLGSASALCGTLSVYENRAAASGRRIGLRVAVIKAQGPDPAPDPIFYLAGGPGVAATEDAAHGQQFPTDLSQRHDLVFVDQRGTGGSHRVVIPPQPDITGMSREEAERTISVWAPRALSALDMDPRFYTTSVAMDDLDEVRAALGYDKINLFGHSYGATAAQYYLRQHEAHVRSVTLSGGSLLDVPLFERWTVSGQRALDLLFERCVADTACHTAFPNVRTEFTALLDRLDQQPETQSFVNPADRQPGSVTFTRGLLSEVVRVMTLDARNAARIPRLIHHAYAQEDWRGITDFFVQYGVGDWGDQLMERVIRCSEKWAAFSPQEVARLGAGTYLESWYVELAGQHAFACSLTPPGETPEGMAAQPHSQVPVLLLNGAADPQNPPDNVAGSKELWPNSLALVEPYQGHWLSSFSEIQCRWAIMAEFIENDSTVGLHTSCLNDVQPPAFETQD